MGESHQTLKAYYEKKHSEGKTFKQSVIAVANKLIRIIFSMLKNGTKFESGFYSLASKKASI